MKINKNSIIYSSFLFTVSSIALQIMGFVYRIFLSRIAGPLVMGVYQLTMSVYPIIISFCFIGLTLAVTQLSAKAYALNDKIRLYRLIKTTIYIFIVLFLIIACVIVAFSEYISQSIIGDVRTKYAILLLLPCIFLTGFENIFKAWFIGIKKIIPPITSELLEQLIRIVAVASLIIIIKPENISLTVALIVVGMIISEIFSSLFLGGIYFKKRNNEIIKGKVLFNSKMSIEILTIAMPILFAGLANNILGFVNTIIIPKRLIVAGLSSIDAISSFGILTSMTMPILMLPGAFIFPLTTVLIPRLSEGKALQNTADLKRKSAKAIHVTMLFACPILITLIPLGNCIATALYKQSAAANHLIPLAIGTIFMFICIITGSILNGVGQQKVTSLCVIICGIIQLVCTWLLVANPKYGIFGYVIGHIISSVFGAIFNMYFVVKVIKIKLRLRNWFVTPLVSSIFVAIFIDIIYKYILFIGAVQLVALLLSLLLGIFIYILVLKLQGVNIKLS